MQQEQFNIVVGEPISSLDISKDYLVTGTLDERLVIWKNQNYAKEFCSMKGHLMGVIDTKIDDDETKVAVSSLDGFIRIWDLDERRLISEIKCDPFENWRVQFIDSFTILTAGEGGRISYFHTETKDRISSIETDPTYFATSLVYQDRLLALGNEGGSVHLLNVDTWKVDNKLKVHGKPIKALKFVDHHLLLTGSDDGLIKLIDLNKMEIVQQFRGHKYGVTDIDVNRNERNFIQQFISCSIDRTVRWWSLDQVYQTKMYSAGNDKPEGICCVRYSGGNVVVGHECGIISFL